MLFFILYDIILLFDNYHLQSNDYKTMKLAFEAK